MSPFLIELQVLLFLITDETTSSRAPAARQAEGPSARG